MSSKTIKPHEDPIPFDFELIKTKKSADQFMKISHSDGDFICICIECGKKFIGNEYDHICPICLDEFYFSPH